MAGSIAEIKKLLSISMKHRHDSITDQYHRVFMMKLFFVVAFITGISWYTDSINCIIPADQKLDKSYVSSTCWIQGIYVYKKQMIKRPADSEYFGMPADIDHDGYRNDTEDKELCTTKQNIRQQRRQNENKIENCIPMDKTFYVQYQYITFLMAFYALLYYVPYIIHSLVNKDIIMLSNQVKGLNIETVYSYFICKDKLKKRQNLKRNCYLLLESALHIVLNMNVKVLYLTVNIVVLLTLNQIMDKEFVSYGPAWIRWVTQENEAAYDYTGYRRQPKPGNLLMPSFGYCEIWESAKDVKKSIANKHKLVCELSQSILYQYSLVVVWLAIVIGLIMSSLGIILLTIKYIQMIFPWLFPWLFINEDLDVWKKLPLQKKCCLYYIRKKKILIYHEIVNQLRKEYKQDINGYDEGTELLEHDSKTSYNVKC